MAKQTNLAQTRKYQLDMLVMVILPCVSAWYFYGARAVALILVSVFTAVICEALGKKLLRQPQSVTDLSAVTTGIFIALVLPASAPLWLPAIGSAFAVTVVKLPFGANSTLPFSHAAAGIAFLTICYPDLVFDYPSVSAGASELSGSAGSSLTYLLSQNTSISLGSVKAIDIFTGNYPGPMGASCIIILIGSALYMLIRRTNLFISLAGFIGGAALIAICFPRITNLLSSIVLELAAGYMIFAAIFLLSEMGTQPKAPISCLLYGFTAGLICMLIRRFGFYEEGACFGILISNAVWQAVDPYIEKFLLKKAKQNQAAG